MKISIIGTAYVVTLAGVCLAGTLKPKALGMAATYSDQ